MGRHFLIMILRPRVPCTLRTLPINIEISILSSVHSKKFNRSETEPVPQIFGYLCLTAVQIFSHLGPRQETLAA